MNDKERNLLFISLVIFILLMLIFYSGGESLSKSENYYTGGHRVVKCGLPNVDPWGLSLYELYPECCKRKDIQLARDSCRYNDVKAFSMSDCVNVNGQLLCDFDQHLGDFTQANNPSYYYSYPYRKSLNTLG